MRHDFGQLLVRIIRARFKIIAISCRYKCNVIASSPLPEIERLSCFCSEYSTPGHFTGPDALHVFTENCILVVATFLSVLNED